MQLVDSPPFSLAEHLACDEVLLQRAEAGRLPETLRLWEPASLAVVLGRSSRVDAEVEASTCLRDGVPIHRRCSGGAAVVMGPGCLAYSLVLSYRKHPGLRMIDAAHRFVLSRVRKALEPQFPGIEQCGTSDLAIAGRKFSGNSLRCGRDHCLYHGTLLFDFDLERISQYLKTPPRQPDYRRGRPHRDFVRNLALDLSAVRESFGRVWEVSGRWNADRCADIRQLAAEKYASPSWTFSR